MNELEFIYRIRSKEDGTFWCGGHSAGAGLFTSEKACRGVLTYHREKRKDWEIIKYRLVVETIDGHDPHQ